MTTPDGGAGSATDTDPVTDAKGRRGAKAKKDPGGQGQPKAGAQPEPDGGEPKAGAEKPAEPKTEGGQRRAAAKPNLRDLVGAPGGNWAPKGEAPVKGLVRAQWDAGQHWAETIGKGVGKALPVGGTLVRGGARALPLIGSLYALTEVAKDLKSGDYIGAGINVVAMLPGPPGWAALFASWAWDNILHHGGTGNLWEAPDGVKTFMLPASMADTGGVAEADQAISDKQQQIFGFQSGPTGTVWGSNPPEALRLDTAEVKTALSGWLTGIANQFAQLEQVMSNSGEPYIQSWREKLDAHFTTMRKLPDHARAIMAELDHASNGAGAWYEALTKVNYQARVQLADHHGSLHDGSAARQLETAEKNAKLVLGNAVKKLGQIAGGDGPKALAPPNRVMPTHKGVQPRTDAAPAPAAPFTPAPLGGGTPMPAPAAPATPAPAPVAPAKTPDTADMLARMLSALGHTPAAPAMGGGMPSMPMGGMPGTGMGNPMGTGLGGASPKPAPVAEPVAAKRPQLATERPKLSTDPADNKVVKPDATKTTAAEAKKEPDKKDAAPAPAAAGVAPVAAGAATPPPAGDHGPTVKPAAAKPPVDTTVDVKGSKIAFPDAKTAALARELAAGGPGHPVSLADAATKAGLQPPVPGQDPGQQVAPSDAKPGDILRAGDKDFMLLDKGRFLDFTAGKVIGAGQVQADLGANGGYFRLRDAMTIDPSTGTPVSGPAPVVTTTAVADHPTVPTDTTPPAATAPAAPVVGTPGVPAKGAAGTGPANAAATDTGRGTPAAPVVAAKPLDPASIK